jgi:hypothetical protein
MHINFYDSNLTVSGKRGGEGDKTVMWDPDPVIS